MLKLTANAKSAQDSPDTLVIPRHVAIIMDGNGRWAKKRGMIRLMGHRQGAQAVTRTVEAAARIGVKTLTLFAFSSENWRRPVDEVTGLMDLFAKVLKGDLSRFSDKLLRAIGELEALTVNNTAMVLNIAINYGGRWDIAQAARHLAMQVQQGTLDPHAIDEKLMQQELAVTEDVDLLIRTGGEQRISNFLLFQCAYSEFYVTDVLWPDFGAAELEQALCYFSGRERRFGRTSEQVAALSGAASQAAGAAGTAKSAES